MADHDDAAAVLLAAERLTSPPPGPTELKRNPPTKEDINHEGLTNG